MENFGQDSLPLFELTTEEKSAIEQAFQTVVAEAAAAQQEYEEAAEPLEREAREKKQKIWTECKALQQPETDTPWERHSQAVKPLEDKIRSVAESFNVQIRTLMESIGNKLPARLYGGLNGEAVHSDGREERELGAMVGPVEIADYNVRMRLVPEMSEADWAAHRALGKQSSELSHKLQGDTYEVDRQLGEALRPFRVKLDVRLEIAKRKYDRTVQKLVRDAMLRAGLDVTGIRLDRQIGVDDDDDVE